MARQYNRVSNRQCWSIDKMNQAITAVKNGELKVSAAANHYQIPRKTLCRYLQKNTVEKRMGRLPELGLQHEKQLVEHLKKSVRPWFSFVT